jgi:predicted TIM-barrel fold metal-dependent hydrolase
MIIDFHTHVFPEKIAAKTVSFLAEKCTMTPYSDGTVNGLLYKMVDSGVDLSVILPVVTNPKQFDSINAFAAEINSVYRDKAPRLISFGGIHPHSEDIPTKMKKIKEMGFLGVKIHPDYQETFIDDDGYVQILSMAKELDLIVVTHAGADPGYREFPVRCTPERARNLIRKVPHSKFVLAHFGANELYDQTLSVLAGEDVYFDTAFALKSISADFFKQLVEKHGEDRILFASDSPWSDMSEDVKIIKSFGLGKTAEDKIFYENAKKLLKL